ncbi:unnamed protein product [Calypogeia fissa]
MAGELTLEDRFAGCLLAGACGDALGEPVELLDLDQIFQEFGPLGTRELNITVDGKATFTDETQMTLFTAEGLLSTILSLFFSNRDLRTFQAEDALPGLHQSYLRWLATQNEESQSPLFNEIKDRGMLVNEEGLQHRRGPGQTCRMSLKSGAVGTTYNEINQSKGCGGIVRVAPCGLFVHGAFSFCSPNEKAELAFKLGCLAAAITHTHPSGWLSSGCLAAIISRILSGDMLVHAINQTIELVENEPNHEETLNKMVEAKQLALEFLREFEETEPTNEAEFLKQKVVLKHFESLGRGLVSEDALGISLYCTLITQKDRDVEQALRYSVNHSGGSDSTGAITGNLVGALYGEAAIPRKWTDSIEMRDLIREVCRDLLYVNIANNKQHLALKYPPPITMVNGEDYYKNRDNLVVPLKMPPGSRFIDFSNKQKKALPFW